MITIDPYFLLALLAANALLLAIASTVLSRFDRRCKRIEEFWDSPTGTALADDGDAESHEQMMATRRLEQRLGELQRAVKLMEIKAPKERPTVERSLPIENAVRMAKSGASIEELTRTCGLNIGEARLMQRLHGRAQLAESGSLQ